MAKKQKLPVAKTSTSECAPSSPYKLTAADKERERRYRAEDALRTCKEYEKIKGDKSLMKDVKQLAKEEMNKLKKVAS